MAIGEGLARAETASINTLHLEVSAGAGYTGGVMKIFNKTSYRFIFQFIMVVAGVLALVLVVSSVLG